MPKTVGGITIDVNATRFKKDLDRMDNKLHAKVLKKVARNTGTKVIIPALKNYERTRKHHEDYGKTRTGNLLRSFGNITTKKRGFNTVFSGPRIALGGSGAWPSGQHKGYILNILENVKPGSHIKKKTNFREVILRKTFQAQMEMHKQLKRIIESL